DRTGRSDGGIVRVRRTAGREPFFDLHLDRVGRSRRAHERDCSYSGGRQRNEHDRFHFAHHGYTPSVRILILMCAAMVALPSVAYRALAFKEGPYPNVTGGFGEQSCHVCHLDNPVNAPGGRLDVEGAPSTHAAGEAYRITISIAREGLRRGGFEIAARFAAGKLKGRQAGTWKPLDDRVQLIPGAADKTLTFVQHTVAGSRAPAPGGNRWTIEWHSPTLAGAGGPVQFNVA